MFVAGMIRHGVRDPGNDPNLNFIKNIHQVIKN